MITKRNLIIDSSLMEAMEDVRESGICNMFDANCVTQALEGIGFYVSVPDYKIVLKEFMKYKGGGNI